MSKSRNSFLTHLVRRSATLFFALVTATSTAFAAAPQLTTQAPGYYRQAFGNFTVTALYDGYVDVDLKLLKGLPAADVQRLVARMFLAHSKGVQTAVNAYLVHTGEQLLLIDAGAGHCFGPTLGKMVDNIRAAGYAPSDVDAVLLTHLHPDHLCGLTAANGERLFPRATVWAAQDDIAFWLNEAKQTAAPADMQPFFQMARDAVAPYQAANAFKSLSGRTQFAPGLTVVASPGHTPGHSSFLLSRSGENLLIWGDIVHNHAVQFARPDVSIEFDTDQPAAIATRKSLMARAAAQAWWVAGAHLPFPGIGHVRAEGDGYVWVPVEYGPIRNDR